VLVHKEFLMTQWAERIEMFLPGVRIGKIQAQTCDMEDKDIVMVMIQSLATKDYPMDLFSGIGLVIVDECHHMSAEVFSNALFKAVTPHMLGLSATMTRKDGLSRVFKMFLGDVVAKRARQGEIKTCVEILRYTNDDEEFNETVLGFNGQISFSSMLSKLSSCEHRLDFIAKRVERLVNEENRVQVMVLTHYRAMISALSDRFLKDKIEHGYYVGGMKQADLDKSAKKTLDTLVLATSKSDVVQAVGRVQRSPDVTPLIVDIVDPHPCFKRQHAKRLTFYRKSKFEIDGTTTEPKPRRKAIAAKKEQAKSNKGQSSGKCMISSAEEDWA
jgi:superfamily II DNA or RNA helicase